MKKIILAVVISMMSVCAFANEQAPMSEEMQSSEEMYSSAAELPEGSVIDTLVESYSGRPSCSKGFLVAKKYCWSWKRFNFRRCGYFCKPIPEPERGKH